MRTEPPAHPPHGERRVRIFSAELMGRDKSLVIVHRGEEYQLRVTRNGKLILTK